MHNKIYQRERESNGKKQQVRISQKKTYRGDHLRERNRKLERES